MKPPSEPTKRIYVSYSHQDSKWLKEMEEEWSAVLLGERGFELFYDKRSLKPSDDVWETLQAGIQSAEVAVLLVTQHYLASETLMNWEFPRLMEARKGTLKIFWILVSTCAWQETPLADILAANDPKRPLDTLRKPARARVWQEVANGILKGIEGQPEASSAALPTGVDRLRFTYHTVLERPELYELLDHFDETQIRAAVERTGGDVEAIVARLEKNHAGSEPNTLWTSWVETVHPDKLGEKPAP